MDMNNGAIYKASYELVVWTIKKIHEEQHIKRSENWFKITLNELLNMKPYQMVNMLSNKKNDAGVDKTEQVEKRKVSHWDFIFHKTQ